MTGESPLIVEREGGVVTLRFNRPAALNALNAAMAEALETASRDLLADKTLRAVLLLGEGRAFMAGGDVAELGGDPSPAGSDRLIVPFHRALANLARLEAPVVAACQGAVAGGGFSLAIAADFVLAAEDAKFTTAYARLGANLDGSSSWTLPRLVGLRKATELAILSSLLDAAEALRIGLVTRVVPAASLLAEARALATTLAQGPTKAYGRIKALLRASATNGYEAQMELERLAFAAGTTTQDFAEGTAAFLGKRKPTFEGR